MTPDGPRPKGRTGIAIGAFSASNIISFCLGKLLWSIPTSMELSIQPVPLIVKLS